MIWMNLRDRLDNDHKLELSNKFYVKQYSHLITTSHIFQLIMNIKSKYPKWAPNITQLVLSAGWVAVGFVGLSIIKKNVPKEKQIDVQTKKDFLVVTIVGGIVATAWTMLPTIGHFINGKPDDRFYETTETGF